jgi:hypothetical protein
MIELSHGDHFLDCDKAVRPVKVESDFGCGLGFATFQSQSHAAEGFVKA